MTIYIKPANPFIEFRIEDTGGSIPQRFEQQVKKYPHRIAIKTEGFILTYNELNRAANQLARAILIQQGENKNPIPLLLKSKEKIPIAILAVLKTGNTWTALNSSDPNARLSYILDDLQTKLVLTDNKNFTRANKLVQNSCQLLNIDESDKKLSDENLKIAISGSALAHIIYTSGSTGQPKGAVHSHSNLLHNIRVQTNSLHLCKDDRLSLLSSFIHTAGVTATFRALLNGAALFPFDLMEKGIDSLAPWLEQEEITIYHSVPTVFRHLTDTLNKENNFPKLRLIHLGGEAVTSRDVKIYKQWFSPNCILLNNLGATEVSTYRNYFINKETIVDSNIAPVGYVVEDKEVLLLDEAGKEVGFNCIGEISVKSDYLAVGYWRQPELTANVFLADPKGGNKRTYLTGDLGLMRPDGCLEYHGRKDHQVKIRGYRIELAEIELALLAHEKIKEVVVIAKEDDNKEPMLVAYLVPTLEAIPSLSELQKLLRASLPYYMIPAFFMQLEAMPLLPNSKIDRQSLPEPVQNNAEKSFIAPRTLEENKLAKIWSKVLNQEKIGIQDNFFELGGHSLLALQIISRINEAFSVDVPLYSFFESSTIEGLMGKIILQLPLSYKEMNEVLAELEQLSEEEAENLIANR